MAQATIRRLLPNDYRQSLLCHDGQVVNEYGCSRPLVYGLDLFPLAKIISRRRMVEELLSKGLGQDITVSTLGPVRSVWWDRLWLPIAEDCSNNYCCFDLNPAEGGTIGQVIQVWNESHPRTVLSKSFGDWITVFSELLYKEKHIYSMAHNGLISLDDAIADSVVKPQPE